MRRNTQGSVLHVFGYSYDNADNMTQRFRFRNSDSLLDVWDYTYNNGNEQLTMTLNEGTPETRTYDQLGRLATRTQGSYSASYSYRYGGRLYQATSNFPGETNVTLNHGGDGKLRTRVTPSETRRYRYGYGFNALNEEDAQGNTVASNVFEPGALMAPRLAQMLGALTTSPIYAYHDHLGSARRWRLNNKSSARLTEYDPYGNLYSTSGVLNMPRIYGLHEFDTGLQQYRAPYRHYRPMMAQWTTPDPMGMIDGPNLYGYVGGRPVIMVDELGQFPVVVIALPLAMLAAWHALCAKWAKEVTSGLPDKNRHCMVACLTNRCSGLTAPATTAAAAVLWELLGWESGGESRRDLIAGFDGIARSYDIRSGCKENCKCYD